MLQKAVHKLGDALIVQQAQDRFFGLLIVIGLLATACGSLATPIPPELATALTKETTPGEHSQTDNTLRPQQAQNHDVKFEHISVEQGLSQSSVFCILQDSRGFMWFGTEEGLNKYDGYSFTVYKHEAENPHGLSDNIVRSIYEDGEGVLWIGTHEGLDRGRADESQSVEDGRGPVDAHLRLDHQQVCPA